MNGSKVSPYFSRRDVEGWSRPAGTYTRDTERDRTDYYSRGQGGRQGGYYESDMESVMSHSAFDTKKPPYSGNKQGFPVRDSW